MVKFGCVHNYMQGVVVNKQSLMVLDCPNTRYFLIFKKKEFEQCISRTLFSVQDFNFTNFYKDNLEVTPKTYYQIL